GRSVRTAGLERRRKRPRSGRDGRNGRRRHWGQVHMSSVANAAADDGSQSLRQDRLLIPLFTCFWVAALFLSLGAPLPMYPEPARVAAVVVSLSASVVALARGT